MPTATLGPMRLPSAALDRTCAGVVDVAAAAGQLLHSAGNEQPLTHGLMGAVVLALSDGAVLADVSQSMPSPCLAVRTALLGASTLVAPCPPSPPWERLYAPRARTACTVFPVTCPNTVCW